MFSHIRTKLANYLRRKNRDRLAASRLRRIKAFDATTKNTREIPKIIHRVLLISTSEGWGDSLYVAGLAQRFKANGAEAVAIMAPESLLEHYGNPVFNVVGSLEHGINSGIAFAPDVAVDLTYMGICCGKERLQLINRLSCPTVTVSELCRHLNAYSLFIPYREKAHISERMALILSVLTHREEAPVMPVGFASDRDKVRACQIIEELFPKKRPARLAYLNTVARDSDRCFSRAQSSMLAQVLLKKGFDGIIVYAKEHSSISDGKIRYLPRVTFFELTAIIAQMDLVVTPDTSVTHLAAFYDIPVFVVFPPNDRDYWPEYAAKESWGGLSTHCVTYSRDDDALCIDSSGYATVRPLACSDYDPSELADSLDKFLGN